MSIIKKISNYFDLWEEFEARNWSAQDDGKTFKTFISPCSRYRANVARSYFYANFDGDNFTINRTFVDLLMFENSNLDLKSAIKKAKKLAGISKIDSKKAQDLEQKTQQKIAESLKEINKNCSESFKKALFVYNKFHDEDPQYFLKSGDFWKERGFYPHGIFKNSLACIDQKTVFFAHKNNKNEVVGIFKRDINNTETSKIFLKGSQKSLFISDNFFSENIEKIVICEGCIFCPIMNTHSG